MSNGSIWIESAIEEMGDGVWYSGNWGKLTGKGIFVPSDSITDELRKAYPLYIEDQDDGISVMLGSFNRPVFVERKGAIRKAAAVFQMAEACNVRRSKLFEGIVVRLKIEPRNNATDPHPQVTTVLFDADHIRDNLFLILRESI